MVTRMHIANTLINILQHHKHTCQRKADIFLEICPAESMQVLQKLNILTPFDCHIYSKEKSTKRTLQKIMIIRTDSSNHKPSHSWCFFHQHIVLISKNKFQSCETEKCLFKYVRQGIKFKS